MRIWAFILSIAFILGASPAPALSATKTIDVLPARVQKQMARGERYALIIGIGKYGDKRIPRLDYTSADARAMYEVLTDPRHGRFLKKNVQLLLDEKATAKEIRRAFTRIRRRARPQDMVLIFYSGHGAPEEGSTYWVPYDADIDDLDSTAVSNNYITRQLGRIRAKRLITFLDSCYSASIVEKKDKPKALFDQDFFDKFRGTGRVTITASDGKELSIESKELGQGVFTHYLVEALKGKADRNKDGAVELEEIWDHVRRRVTDEAQRRGNRQRPQLIGSLSAGLLVSLNPGVLARFGKRKEMLASLLLKGSITGMEYEEAKRALDGEGDMRLLPIVRDLTDGKLPPEYYRSARAEALGKKGPPASVPPPETVRVASLLKKADGEIAIQRLTSPKGTNAYETLQEALRISPGHPGAIERLNKIIARYKAWARQRIESGQFRRARAFIDRARTISG
ncbi:MAG: caspase family protein, partial [Nitrospinota bacterium]